jgi:uncharacterized RDD family membrane protein YckC
MPFLGYREQVPEHRPADPVSPRRLAGVHRLDLAVRCVEVLERADAEKSSIAARTEERDGRVEESLDVQRVDMLGGTELVRVGEVDFQELAHVVRSRIFDREDEIGLSRRSVQFRHPSDIIPDGARPPWQVRVRDAGPDHDCAVSPGPRPQKLLGRLVAPVVDAVDPDALLERVDLDDLVARVDIDAALRHVDIDHLVSRIDLDALLQRVDVDAIVQRVDVNAVVERVDVDAVVQRVDIENIVQRVRVGSVVADTAADISSRSLEAARRTVARVDAAVERPIDRAAGRDRDPDRAVPPGLAGPGARLGAWFLDTVVISASFTIGVAIAGYLASLFTRSNVDPTRSDSIWWVVAGIAWAGLYFFLAWWLTQRTVGMAVVGIRVMRSDRSPVRARDSAIRVVVFPFSFILGLGLVGIVIGRRRRALHDVAAGTLVASDVAIAHVE